MTPHAKGWATRRKPSRDIVGAMQEHLDRAPQYPLRTDLEIVPMQFPTPAWQRVGAAAVLGVALAGVVLFVITFAAAV